MPPVVPLRFASIYTDHVVLQAAPLRSVVWGFANVPLGTPVTVTVDGPEGFAVQGALLPLPSGTPYSDQWIWRAVLPATAASLEPHSITVSAIGDNATIIDVLFGDVYVCGGQVKLELAAACVYVT